MNRAAATLLLLCAVAASLLGAADAKAAHVCVSSGDTHMYPFGGLHRFDIYNPRPFVLTAYNTGDHNRRVEVQATQAYGAWGGRTVDNNLAVRCGRDLVVFRQPRNGNPPSITLNGRPHTIASGRRLNFPSAPARSRGRYYTYARHNAHWHTYTIDCNHRGYERDYAFGFKVAVQWFRPFNHWWYRRHGASRYVYGNVQVEIQSRFAGKLERGACGWTRNGRQPRHINHLIQYRQSLFSKTPADHAREAKAGAKVSDPRRLRQAAARCARGIYKATGVSLAKAQKYFGRLDKNVGKTIKNFIHGCAIDLYFGVGHSMNDMAGSVCNWVAMATDSVYQDSVRLMRRIRSCKKPYTDPRKLIPFLEEKYRLAQFCNRSPPRRRDPLPGGKGFSPTCQQLEAGRSRIKQLSSEQQTKARALGQRARDARERASQEANVKAGERSKLEEEAKKIEKEKQETEALEQKAREDLQKRLAAKAEGAKVPEAKNDGPAPGSKMVQKSKVFISDATGVQGTEKSDAKSTAAAPAEESSEESSESAAAEESSSEASEETEETEETEESTGPTPVSF